MEGLDGGDVFPDVLDKAVKNAKAVVGVWSSHALTRPWVKIECDIGRTRGVLVPVQIEQIGDLDRPAAFWNLHYDDLSQFDGDISHPSWIRFVRSLSRTLNRPDLLVEAKRKITPAQTPSAAHTGADIFASRTRTPASPSRSPAGAIAFGLLVIAISAAAIALWTLGRPPEQLADGSSSNPGASIAAVTAAANSAEGQAANDAAWDAASKDGSREALNAYLKLFPKGTHAPDAIGALKKLDDLAAAERAAKQAEAARVAEQAAWKNTTAADTVVAYDAFLSAYPKSSNRAEALSRRTARAARDADVAAWNSAERANSSVSYESYLSAYPSGVNASLARDRLATARRNEAAAQAARLDDDAWAAARATNSAAAYDGYLATYPSGRHAAEARQAKAALSPPAARTLLTSPITTTPQGDQKDPSGRECRNVRQIVVVNGQEEAQDWLYCRGSNGQWSRQ